VTWREGTKGKMSSRFATELCGARAGRPRDPRSGSGLAAHGMAAWREGSDDFTATTLPANMSRRQLVRRVKQRWRTERVYEDAKESLGWITTRAAPPRWNHHVSMVLVCFAFIVAERSRAFPPSAGKNCHAESVASHDGADGNPPGAALPGFLHHCAPGRRARPGHMVTRCPLVHRPRSMGPPGAHARETPTDDSLFESVVLPRLAHMGERPSGPAQIGPPCA